MTAPAFPHLRVLQEHFWRLLVAPEGVAQGASQLASEHVLQSEDLSFLVQGDARLGPVERLDVYADMYFYRLRDCLKEDYPKLAAWIGDTRFHNLVTDYLLVHPSTHPSLRELGRALPGFLESHAVHEEFPGATELARLEWARVDVFDETDARPLLREDFLARAGEPPESFALAIIPACRLLRVDARIPPLWKQLHEEGRAPHDTLKSAEPTPMHVGVRVWRKEFAVIHATLADDEADCLQVLAGGAATLAHLGDALLARPDLDPDRVGLRLAELLDLWARAELLTDPDRSEA